MKKLKLNLDDLQVQSFVTVSIEDKKGTVIGNILITNSPDSTCNLQDTCDAVCANTNFATCAISNCNTECPGNTCCSPPCYIGDSDIIC